MRRPETKIISLTNSLIRLIIEFVNKLSGNRPDAVPESKGDKEFPPESITLFSCGKPGTGGQCDGTFIVAGIP